MDNLLLYGGLAITAWLMLKPKKEETPSSGGFITSVKRSITSLKTAVSRLPSTEGALTSASGPVYVAPPEHEQLTPVKIEQYTTVVPPGSDYVVVNGIQIHVTRSGEYWYDENGTRYTIHEVFQA